MDDLEELVSRRTMVAALPGGALFLASWLNAADQNYNPKFFTPDDFAALRAFTEILIPSDEFPGAREARCAEYIDFVVNASAEEPNVQSSWRKAMEAVKQTGFYTATPQRRLELMSEMSQPELLPDAQHRAYFAYRLIKRQTAFAFYTSKPGSIQTLDYKGNTYNMTFPACHHPEHQTV
jgi:hypothetical protein